MLAAMAIGAIAACGGEQARGPNTEKRELATMSPDDFPEEAYTAVCGSPEANAFTEALDIGLRHIDDAVTDIARALENADIGDQMSQEAKDAYTHAKAAYGEAQTAYLAGDCPGAHAKLVEAKIAVEKPFAEAVELVDDVCTKETVNHLTQFAAKEIAVLKDLVDECGTQKALDSYNRAKELYEAAVFFNSTGRTRYAWRHYANPILLALNAAVVEMWNQRHRCFGTWTAQQ